MDVVGSEIGQKMRSAIKAKLTELGCYVDDELPDYVMVMVANKRTRAQMEDDLQLFLGDNTELFVNWLHQVLKKLQEVTVTPAKVPELEKHKEKKEKKLKDKKERSKAKKADPFKKAKKKDKEKSHKKKEKEERKAHHKSKKKSKHHEMIHPNVPPLLMNMEKVSEPSITDVFAGQILKSHGFTLDMTETTKTVDKKPIVNEPKRPMLPIIDPQTISSQPDSSEDPAPSQTKPSVTAAAPREDQIKEMNEIEAKIQGLKQKLVEQLDSMSDDEDFLNIRTEAEELMNDFAEDVFQEISSQAPVSKSPDTKKSPTPTRTESPTNLEKNTLPVQKEVPAEKEPLTTRKEPSPICLDPSPIRMDPPKEPETLPHIELNLPKRPVRERLGAREESKKDIEAKKVKDTIAEATKKTKEVTKKSEEVTKKSQDATKKFAEVTKVTEDGKKVSSKQKDVEKRTDSPERFTPDREPDFWPKSKSARSRLGDHSETRKVSSSDDSLNEPDFTSKKVTSKVSTVEASVAGRRGSVVLVKPRTRTAPAPNLLLRAVADAHKSLLNIPPKVDSEPSGVKRALVLPMRRTDAHNIVIEVPQDRNDKGHKMDIDRDEYIPAPITKRIFNTDYVPSRRPERISTRKDETLIIETLNIHNTTVDKDAKTQFIVTMDGFNPNAFLEKKLMTEGLLNEDDEEKPATTKSVLRTIERPRKTELVSKVDDSSQKGSEKISKSRKVTDKGKKPLEQEKKSSKTEKRSIETEKIVLEKENISTETDETSTEKGKPKEPTKTSTEAKRQRKDSSDNIPITEEDCEIKDDTSDEVKTGVVLTKRLSNTSDESDTQVIINKDDSKLEKRKSIEDSVCKSETNIDESPPMKKRKASPIVFDKKEKEEMVEKGRSERTRTESASSDNHVIVTTKLNTHKYDSVPPLSATVIPPPPAERKPWCRSFPLCRFGAACAFAHPPCKFAAACTRRGCPYAHQPKSPAIVTPPIVASHVVPAANYKTISPASIPTVCKFYPKCVNPSCHFYHPKPCRYGAACANKLDCNFYHADTKWRYTL